MTFLQPYVLWGLPLVLLPVVIHLLNRLRHRPQPWAAMRFLLKATRSSTGHARLRQFLILLLRVLAVLTLVIFLGRPLAGGWMGWALSPAPDAILILLDRSASMETKLDGASTTRREQALKLVVDAAREFEETSHLVLIDSASRSPQQIGKAASLLDAPFAAPTDTAADMPALFQSAANWLIENKAGAAEIWIASDLQRSNWLPEDSRWKNVTAQLEAMPQKVRVRLLSVGHNREGNISVSLKELLRRQRGESSELALSFDFQRLSTSSEPVPVSLTIDGTSAGVEVPMESQSLRWRHRANLRSGSAAGWGKLELPADANGRDNVAYFVYGAEAALHAGVVAADPAVERFLRLAGTDFTPGKNRPASGVSLAQTASASWADETLVIWQAPLPTGTAAERLRKFIDEGGEVIFFPPGQPDSAQFEGVGWGEIQSSEGERGYRVARWDEEQGPLAKSDEGISLPLTQTTFLRRQAITGRRNVLAAFDDGVPFLTRLTIGQGEAIFCASLPAREWSSLADGPVLVPMLQRMLQAGGRRLQQTATIDCGELNAADRARRWSSVDGNGNKDILTQAGVYQSGESLVAVNRPKAEDELEVVEEPAARALFGTLPTQSLQERQVQTNGLQGEVWRIFLFGMLLFMIGEGFLILPARTSPAVAARGEAGKPVVTTRAGELAS